MNAPLAAAFEPAAPGMVVRAFGTIVPGVRRTGEQIVSYADSWRSEAELAIADGCPVFVALGDSLAQGVGASSVSASYVQLVADRLHREVPQGFRILNLSRSGARLADVLETQLPALATVPNSVIGGICTVGSNDLVRSGRLRQTRRRFTAVLEALPIEILMATIPDAKSVTAKTMNRYLRSEANRLRRPLADVATALTSWKGLMAGDAFHPNDAGHQLWAKAITEALLQNRAALR